MSPVFELRLELPLARFELSIELSSSARSLGVFGPSGAGKTSLLESVAGWRRGARGRLAVGGRVLLDVARGIDVPLARRGVGYVPQDLLLLDDESAHANLLLGPRARHDVFARAVEILELGDVLDRACRTLSGGERQRVALGRALCSAPEVLLLDEPLASLDLGLRSRILPYLWRIREEFRLPTLYVSHDPTEVLALCDEVAVLERGRVVAQGQPGEVLLPRITGAPSYENVVQGVIESVDGGLAAARIAQDARVLLGASGLVRGERVLFALSAADILVSTTRPVGLSARNLLEARVASIETEGATAWLEAQVGSPSDGARLVSALTPAAVADLDLREGADVRLVFKTSACRVLAIRGPL